MKKKKDVLMVMCIQKGNNMPDYFKQLAENLYKVTQDHHDDVVNNKKACVLDCPYCLLFVPLNKHVDSRE